ncbi:MAG TPA: archease, partial [Nitrospiraceae bacterium]
MAWTFRFLEDIAMADIGFEAEGASIEEVFRAATQALIESMANPSTVSGGWERAIERSDVDPAVLLFEWLSEVVYWKDAAGVVFREAPLTLTREGEVWLLRAGLIGAPVNHQ